MWMDREKLDNMTEMTMFFGAIGIGLYYLLKYMMRGS